MSVVIGNILAPVVQVLSGTSATDIGDPMPDKFRMLTGFSFANDTGSAVVCQLLWRPNGAVADSLLWSGSVETYETEPDALRVFPVKLGQGDKIKAKGASGVSVVLYYTLTYQTAAARPV